MTATEPAKLKRKHNSGIALFSSDVHNESMKHVDVFTDGACLGNPGPGGYGVILKHAKQDFHEAGLEAKPEGLED